MKVLKRIVIVLIVLIAIFFVVKGNFTIVNETGYLGMDNDGRQMLLRSIKGHLQLNSYKPNTMMQAFLINWFLVNQ